MFLLYFCPTYQAVIIYPIWIRMTMLIWLLLWKVCLWLGVTLTKPENNLGAQIVRITQLGDDQLDCRTFNVLISTLKMSHLTDLSLHISTFTTRILPPSRFSIAWLVLAFKPMLFDVCKDHRVEITFSSSRYRKRFLSRSSFVVNQRPVVVHPEHSPVTFVTVYDAPY